MTEIVTTPAVVADLQAAFDGLRDLLDGLLQEVSGAADADAVSTELLSGKISDALAAIEAVRSGVETNGGHLTALSSAVAADFDDVRALLTGLLAAVAAIPAVDTAALEQLIAASNETIGVVLDVVNGISDAQDSAMSELTALASAVAGITGAVYSIASSVSGIATDIASINARLALLETGTPGGGDPDPEPALLPLAGFNLSGLGNNPHVDPIQTASLGTHYRTPVPVSGQPDYVAILKEAAGLVDGEPFIARLPFAGERIAILDGQGGFSLRSSYVEEIRAAIRHVHSLGGQVLLDMHNYCRWYKKVDGPVSGRVYKEFGGGYALWTAIGASDCPVNYAMLADIWAAIVNALKGEPGIWGYGLMNEPHSRGATIDGGVDIHALWIANAQQIVDAVRAADGERNITICGNGYATAKFWRSVSDGLKNVTDSAGKLFFEAHQYPDTQPGQEGSTNNHGAGGGQWQRPQPFGDTVDPAARVNDWADFVAWLKENGLKGFAGEFGGPVDVGGMPQYLTDMHAYFNTHNIPRTQWLLGPGFASSYANGMNNADGSLKPNADALVANLGGTCSVYGPTPA